MFKFISGVAGAVVKTTIGLPVSAAADVATLGGDITNKRGNQSYTGDMLDSIGDSLDEMTEHE